jgi:transposase-like protein
MSDDERSDEGQELADELAEERRAAGGTNRWRCSDELRARVVTYVAACREVGESHVRVARRLGVAQPTLSRWVREAHGSQAEFREMAIVPIQRRSAPAVVAPLRLLSPRGFVVEGLAPELLAYLLRVIG